MGNVSACIALRKYKPNAICIFDDVFRIYTSGHRRRTFLRIITRTRLAHYALDGITAARAADFSRLRARGKKLDEMLSRTETR